MLNGGPKRSAVFFPARDARGGDTGPHDTITRHASDRLDPPLPHRRRPRLVRGQERAGGHALRLARPDAQGAARVRAARGVRGRRSHRIAGVGSNGGPAAARNRPAQALRGEAGRPRHHRAARIAARRRAADALARMEFELWWLLALPVFFGMGWVAARVDIKSLLSESSALPSSYFRGLNFLLNEQPDKAIESFLQVAKENPQTVELQFALGSLFRRRGEVDRAIRMHQDLVNREDLPSEQRRTASFELAQDYFKAGLLDHAEQVLAGMAEADPAADVHRQ